jgi:flagellar biosynthesis/type III secretory pathway M-ring protein FliF/YscJ
VTKRQAVAIGIVAGVTAAVVLLLLWVAVYFMVGGSGNHHVVELGPDGQPTYTTVP